MKFVQGLPACRGCGWNCFLDRPVCVEDIPVEVVAAAVVALHTKGDFAPVELAVPLPPGVAPDRLHVLACRQLRRSGGAGAAAQHTVVDLAERLAATERVAAALRTETRRLAEQLHATAEDSQRRLDHIHLLEARLLGLPEPTSPARKDDSV